MSNLLKHSKKELELAGLFKKDSDYEGMIGKAVIELIKVFSRQGHSGFSAKLTLGIFNKVASFENLTPITSNPDDWMDVSEMSGEPMWQCKRSFNLFSKDGGKTWYDVNKKISKLKK